jgi:hypothetical protein
MPYWRTLNHYALSWQCERGCSEEQLVRIPFQVNFQALFVALSDGIELYIIIFCDAFAFTSSCLDKYFHSWPRKNIVQLPG